MSAWKTVDCLLALRDEFNDLNPNRDKGADGTIGDSSHTSSSDHTPDEDSSVLDSKDSDDINEVHALDVDSSGPWPHSFGTYVQTIVNNHRYGRDNRLQNVIYDHHIYSRSWGWTAHDYSGADPHTNHAHFSARYGSGSGSSNPENDTSPWGISEGVADVAMTTADADLFLDRMNTRLRAEPDSALALILRAAPWQYASGGLPTGVTSALTALSGAYTAAVSTAASQVAQSAKIDAILSNVQADDNEAQAIISAAQAQADAARDNLQQQLAQLHSEVFTEINQIPAEVLQELGNPDTPDQQVAQVLRDLLGSRAPAVGALLTA